MGDMLACLRGWHPGLARAELQALLPGAALASDVSPRWCRVEGATSAQREEALNVASGLQCFLLEGVVQSTQTVDKTAWLAIMQTYLDQHPVEGTVAVRAWKQGRKISGWSLSKLSGRLGGMLHDMGCVVNLSEPDHVLALIAVSYTHLTLPTINWV